MKSNRLLPLVLVVLLLWVTGCSVTSVRELPLIAQFLPATPTVTPLLTATSTAIPRTTASVTTCPTPTDVPLATATLPSVPPPSVTAVEIARGNPDVPWIALTFDAGSSIAPLPSILETLRQKDVHCTFFVTGIMLRQAGGPKLLQQLVADGHELGNHSDTHPNFTELTDEQMGVELAEVEDAVLDITGRSTKPYFRPPFGNRDDRVRRVVHENGYLNIYWTYHVWDWTGDKTAEEIYGSVSYTHLTLPTILLV